MYSVWRVYREGFLKQAFISNGFWEEQAICQIVFILVEIPDKVVKVDVLRGRRGDGVHAEELRFSFAAGRGREGGAGGMERRTEKGEIENTVTRLKQGRGR